MRSGRGSGSLRRPPRPAWAWKVGWTICFRSKVERRLDQARASADSKSARKLRCLTPQFFFCTEPIHFCVAVLVAALCPELVRQPLNFFARDRFGFGSLHFSCFSGWRLARLRGGF